MLWKHVVMAVIASSLAACGGSGAGPVDAEPGSPSRAMQSLMRAVATEDVDTYVMLLDSSARAAAESSRQLMPDEFEGVMKDRLAVMSGKWTGLVVRSESITGNRAAVTLEDGSGETVEVPFVLETDGWKISLMSGSR